MVPDFSIVIPTKNEEKFLPRLLKSIEEQSILPKEIIISDANSEDRTRQIAKSYGCIVCEGGLPGRARNNGAKLASSKVIIFLDADGFLTKSFLKKFIEKFESSGSDVACTSYIPDTKNLFDRFILMGLNLSYFFLQRIYPHGSGACIAINKNVFRELGGFNEKMVMGEDNDLVKRASKKYKYSFFFNPKLYMSMRRFERVGRINLLFKYLIADFTSRFGKGIFTDRFEYWENIKMRKK